MPCDLISIGRLPTLCSYLLACLKQLLADQRLVLAFNHFTRSSMLLSLYKDPSIANVSHIEGILKNVRRTVW